MVKREIKFRGKDSITNEWRYGGFVCGNKGSAIIEPDPLLFIIVDPDTVGQFTGLKDKEGVDIYEGDVVTMVCGIIMEYDDADHEGWRPDLNPFDDGYWTGVINWTPSGGIALRNAFWTDDLEGGIEKHKYEQNFYSTKETKVVGNIHDNPELLEEK